MKLHFRLLALLGFMVVTSFASAEENRLINPGESTLVKSSSEDVTVSCSNNIVSTFCRCVATDRLNRRASLILSGLLANGDTKDIQVLGTFASSGIDPLDPMLVTAIQQCQRAAQRTPACFR